MKQKKPLTLKQQKNRKRVAQYVLFAGEFAVLPIPFATMAIINREEWFVNNPNAWQIGLGGSIAIALTAIMMLLVGAKKENKELTGGYITLILIWYGFAFAAMLFSQIMYEIYKVMMICGTGMLAAFGLDQGSKYFKKQADEDKVSIENARKDLKKDQAKEEMKSRF